MFRTRITEMFGIEYPIIGGAMMHLAKVEYTAAVSEAGGLGVLASANYKDMGEFREALRKIKELTKKPFAVNLNFFPALNQIDNNLYLDVMIDEGVKIVETSGHKAPEEIVGRIKEAGMLLVHKCVGVRYAKKAEKIGADAVTVVGYENGGATGNLDITTLCLVPRVVDEVSIPVIGGGGVSDGRTMAAVLALGAEG
ncbi:MAG: nitronate monooxygenase, partial [Deltaproteobacteria bacterium]